MIWFFKRRHRYHKYKLDRRSYVNGMGPGLFAFLGRTRFWEVSNDKYSVQQKALSVMGMLLRFTFFLLAIWFVYESIKGISIYL